MTGQIVAYVRVSTTQQNVARQVSAVGQVDKTFTDHASGRGRGERPGLTEMLEWLREGDTVRVASMDRLARSMSDLYNLVGELTKSGVTVEFLREGLKFGSGKDDATSRLLLGVMGSIAEFERELIRERQAEGIRAAKARGVYKGRKVALADAAVEGARRRIKAGVPKSVVARELGVSRQTLYNALSRTAAGNQVPDNPSAEVMVSSQRHPVVRG